MKDNQCPICEAKADIKEIDGGVAYLIRCFGNCPQFEIPKGIESEIRKIHGRQPDLREGMKEFKATHPDSVALVRPNPDGPRQDDFQINLKNYDGPEYPS